MGLIVIRNLRGGYFNIFDYICHFLYLLDLCCPIEDASRELVQCIQCITPHGDLKIKIQKLAEIFLESENLMVMGCYSGKEIRQSNKYTTLINVIRGIRYHSDGVKHE